MPASCKYLLQILIPGLIACHSAVILAQQDTIPSRYEATEPIDTSDYIPSFYDNALDFNLMIASSKGYISEIERLIGLGADVNTESIVGVTPLIFAIINNQLEAVRTLLKYDPDLDKITSAYETPLIIAVKNNNFEICETLIRAGADVDLPDGNGASPLHYASLNGYFEITDLAVIL